MLDEDGTKEINQLLLVSEAPCLAQKSTKRVVYDRSFVVYQIAKILLPLVDDNFDAESSGTSLAEEDFEQLITDLTKEALADCVISILGETSLIAIARNKYNAKAKF